MLSAAAALSLLAASYYYRLLLPVENYPCLLATMTFLPPTVPHFYSLSPLVAACCYQRLVSCHYRFFLFASADHFCSLRQLTAVRFRSSMPLIAAIYLLISTASLGYS